MHIKLKITLEKANTLFNSILTLKTGQNKKKKKSRNNQLN